MGKIKKETESSSRDLRKIWKIFGPAAIYLILFVVVVLRNSNFLTGGGLGISTQVSAAILMVALSQSLVLNIGSIDLSNASLSLFGAIVLAKFLPHTGVMTPLLILVLTTLCGAVNGALVAYTKAPSFALTLGTLGIFQTAALVISKATTVYVDNNDAFLGQLNNITLFSIPLIFYIGALLAIALWAFMRYTTAGRDMTAIGLNETGAIFAGLRIKRIKILAFSLAGFMSGFAGITIISQSGSASPNGLGSDLLLPGIAAAIVGGTSILGGVTNPINVVFGSLIISMIPITSTALGVNAEAQSLIYGIAIITVAAFTLSNAKKSIVK